MRTNADAMERAVRSVGLLLSAVRELDASVERVRSAAASLAHTTEALVSATASLVDADAYCPSSPVVPRPWTRRSKPDSFW